MNRTISTGPATREKSPQPVRSPSPDYVARSAIFSTKSPSSAEIVQIAGLTPPKHQRIPLLEEIAELRKENKQLHERLDAVRPGVTGVHLVRTLSQGADSRDQIAILMEEIRRKDQELAELRAAVPTNIPSFPVDSASGSKFSPAKRISLIKTESQQIKDMNDQIKQLTEQNEELRKGLRETKPTSVYSAGGQPSQPFFAPGQQDQLTRRIRELELKNDELKAELTRAQKLDSSRDSRQILESLRMEPTTDNTKLAQRVVRIKQELERSIQEFKIQISHRLHEMEQRILEITKKQSEILAVLTAQKKEKRLSEGKSSRYSKDIQEQQPIYIEDQPKPDERYSTPNKQQQPVIGARLESTAPIKGTSASAYQTEQLNQQLLQEQSLTNQLRRQLESKTSDYERLNDFTEHLKSQIDNLNRQLVKARGTTAPQQPLSSSGEGSQPSATRIERENDQLKTQITTINNFVDQLKREKSQQEDDIKGLTDTIVELRNTIVELRGQLTREIGRREPVKQAGREAFISKPSQAYSQGDYSQLQRDNRTLRETLEALRNSHSQLMNQLEKLRKEQGLQPPAASVAPSTGQWFDVKPPTNAYQRFPSSPSAFPAVVNESQQTYPLTSGQETSKPPSYPSPLPIETRTSEPSGSVPPISPDARLPAYQTLPSATGDRSATYGQVTTEVQKKQSVSIAPPGSAELSQKNIELQQLRAEVSRLKATNELLQKEKNELDRNRQLQSQEPALRRTHTSDLTSAADELAKERERSALRDRDYQNLKVSFDRINSEMIQIPLLKEQAAKERTDAERYKRIAEENSLDLSILRREKEALQVQLKDYTEMKKRNDDNESLLKIREDEIAHLRKPYRSVEFDSILKELQVVRQELQRIKLEEIPKDVAALVQNIRQLLAEKTATLRSVRKSQGDYASLSREISRLKKENLDLSAKYTSEREENQRLKLQIESLRNDNLTYQREVNRLKDLIADYVNKDESREDAETLASEEERKWMAAEEESVRISQSYEKSVGHELDNIRSCCQYARLKLENITDKIVQELTRPREPAP